MPPVRCSSLYSTLFCSTSAGRVCVRFGPFFQQPSPNVFDYIKLFHNPNVGASQMECCRQLSYTGNRASTLQCPPNSGLCTGASFGKISGGILPPLEVNPAILCCKC